MATWDPRLYLSFGTERTRPAADLLARVPIERPRRVIDLGCGPGNSTALLRARWPDADLTGLDSDAAMLETAKADASIHWVQGDAASWSPTERFDVVYSNAMLQWLPEHETLVPRLMEAVAPGGALAVQTPVHFESPLHKHIQALADSDEWREKAQGAQRMFGHDPAFYYDLLRPNAAGVDLWVTEYQHPMESHEAILAWIKGTGLRPILAAVGNDAPRFEAALLERIAASYPRRIDGRVLFPFRRLFFVATR